QRRGWEADERPEPRSLGLLPSGPDPVGEWLAHRQPPGLYIGRGGRESKPRCPAAPGRSGQLPPGVVVIEPPGLGHGLVAAKALAPGVAQAAAQARQRRGEMIVTRAGARAEHSLAGARLAQRLIGGERRVEIVGGAGNGTGEHAAVLDRHRGALPEI